MKRLLTALLLTICFGTLSFGQDDADTKTKRMLDEAAKNGRPMHSEISVNGNVHVQAVLIPRRDARRIFGSQIANNYAVVEVNVGNKSPDAALIIHGIFVDYSRWPVSGSTPAVMNADRSKDQYQESNFSTQVASEEYRLVRGELLDAQTDTWRNRVLRYLTWAGSLAGAFTFSINEQGFIRGIASANGVGIPGFATAFPDKTVEQLNRISDLGFRANKVISKQGSDVIVCFFPIDRFLTPGFKKIYLDRPALFFAPLLMLADKSVEKDAEAVIGDLVDHDTDVTFIKLKQALPYYMTLTHPESPGYGPSLNYFGLEPISDASGKETRLRVIVRRAADGKEFKDANGHTVAVDEALKKFKTLMILDFLKNLSLNRATVTIDGVMAVNVNEVAARIDEVAIDNVTDCGDAGGECLWTNLTAEDGVRTGVIRGAFMKDADVAIAEADARGIKELKKVDEGSTPNELHFSFKLTEPVPNQTKLHFTVTKAPASSGSASLESNTYEYVVAYFPNASSLAGPATLSSDKTKLTVTGKRLGDHPRVTFVPEAGDPVNVDDEAAIKVTHRPQSDSLEITLPALDPGCWYAQVRTTVQGVEVTSNRSEKFAIETTPKLTSARRKDDLVQIFGENLIDYSKCDGPKVEFKLKNGDDVLLLEVKNWNRGAPVILKLPEKAKEGDWTVQLFFKGNAVAKDAGGETPLK